MPFMRGVRSSESHEAVVTPDLLAQHPTTIAVSARDGDELDLLVKRAPSLNADGQHVGWILSLVDVTEMRQAPRVTAFQAWGDFLIAWLDHSPTDMLAALSALAPLKIHDDPEFVFRVGWLLCDVSEHEQGLSYLRRALNKAYFVAPTLSANRSFDPLRTDPRFQAILAEAEVGRQQALAAFREAGGERLLG